MIVKSLLTKSTSQVPMSQLDKYWLDFGINKYKPYALQGGATDLHMPFVAQVNLPGVKFTALCTSLHIPCQQHCAPACTFHVDSIVHQLAQSDE